MSPELIYEVGIAGAFLMAFVWSFIFDKNKPPTVREFIAKLIARALFIGFIYIVIVGFFYLAVGTGYGS